MKLFRKFLPVLVLALCASFSSCQNDDEVITDPAALIGTWKYASVSYNVQTSIPAVTELLKTQIKEFFQEVDMKVYSITLNADKTYSATSIEGTETGTYSATNGTLTLNSADNDENETMKYSISGSKLTVTNELDTVEFSELSSVYPGLKITKLAISIILDKQK